MKRFSTTLGFINSHVQSAGFPAGEVIETHGYTTSGDRGLGKWAATGNVIAPSQTVLDTNDIKISDASGNEFELIHSTIIDLNVLGGTAAPYVTIATNAGLVWVQSFTSIESNAVLSYATLDILKNSSLDVGDVGRAVKTEENTAGNGGGGEYSVVLTSAVTPNGYNIIQSVAEPLISFVLRIIDNIYNIAAWGAINGLADNTSAMQAAATAAGVTGGVYFVPAGLWIHGQIDIPSNITMRGVGVESVDQRLSDVGNPTVTKVGYRLFNTDTVAPFDPALNNKDVTIENIKFSGTVVADGFEEFKHLIMCQGVTNLTIQNCWFYGWQGDAVVVRSGNATAAAQNKNVKILNCAFDGVNNDNRNAITANDFDGLHIIDCTFANCTRSNMPGAIDVEPNVGDTFVILRDLNIKGNSFKNIGGNVGAIALYLPDGLTTEAQSFRIIGNDFDGVYKGFHVAQAKSANVTEATFNSDIYIGNNTVRNATDRDFWLYGMRGITLENNTFEEGNGSSRVGWLSEFREVNGIKLINNTFRHSSKGDGSCIIVYGSSDIEFRENTFDNIGASGGGFGVPITFSDGYSALPCSKLRLFHNKIINNEGLTTGAVSVTGTVTDGSNYQIGNEFAGLSSSFVANFTNYGERSVEQGITALAGGQAGAYQLTKDYNKVTGGAAFDGVKLPSSVGDGRRVYVTNALGVSIQVFPFSNDDLGNGVNAPISIAANASRLFVSEDLVNWITI